MTQTTCCQTTVKSFYLMGQDVDLVVEYRLLLIKKQNFLWYIKKQLEIHSKLEEISF